MLYLRQKYKEQIGKKLQGMNSQPTERPQKPQNTVDKNCDIIYK